MRKLAGFVGVVMLLVGVTLLFVGAKWATGVNSDARGQAWQTGWTCQDPGTPPQGDWPQCRATGMPEAAQAAGSAAGLAWVGTGIALTLGGSLLTGALIVSAGRASQQAPHRYVPPQQSMAQAGAVAPQQVQQATPTGFGVPQPNYGQQQRPQ